MKGDEVVGMEDDGAVHVQMLSWLCTATTWTCTCTCILL